MVRLFYWQVYRGKDLAVIARSQYQNTSQILAPRGEILASDSSWLAASNQAWLIYASLPLLTEPVNIIADKLAPLFVENNSDKNELLIESSRLKDLLSKNDVAWVPLKQKITGPEKNEIENFDIKGIGFEQSETRSYPEASTAAQLLGFVGKDKDGNDKGYFGLEGFYDAVLSGKPGLVSREEDATGVPILLGTIKNISAISGVNLVTSIDKGIQIMLDRQLEKGIEKYGAKAGTAIIMEPKSGKIVAMSSFPSFDPAKYWDFNNSLFINPAISSQFEPGSIFKVLVMASALDNGVIAPETHCDICSGPVHIDNYSIETWNQVYHPDSSMTDIIVNSDNVGMVFVGRKIGADVLYDYLSKFGIGNLTGIDLQGEMSPKMRDKGKWGQIDLATSSFGQGIAVTPIQMVKAVATIANGGISVNPYVVDSVSGKGWQEKIDHKLGSRVISEKAAREITLMMAEAAKNGESKWTYMKGYNVAAKTGTAQIPLKGYYEEDKTIASFIGFAPYDKPKFVMLVTLREPSTSPWSAETAAPLWYSIAKELFLDYNIQPSN